jgi:carboxyl-terminal processing protease
MNLQLKDYGRSMALGAFAGILMAVIFAAGFFTRDLIDISLARTDTTVDFSLLGEVQLLLQRHYLREIPDQTALQYAAIRGLLTALGDRNTFFIDPPVAQSESDALAGTYGGIGIQLQRSTTGEYILFPFEDSPAKAAGIADGDVLVAVNQQPITTTMQQDAVDQLLRGEVKDNNGVEITFRNAEGEEQTQFILFAVINVPSVVWRVLQEAPEIGYMHVLRFTNRTPDETRQAITELRADGITAFILDLRNDGGGLLQESVQVAGEFLNGGIVLTEKTKTNEKVFEADTDGLMTDLPLVVLVNGGTASAAELVAGAIVDRERGILIGQRTYGKGTIQQIFELSDKSSIHVTSAEWFTPKGNAIDGIGLSPTIVVEPDASGRDLELAEAIRYLQAQLTN